MHVWSKKIQLRLAFLSPSLHFSQALLICIRRKKMDFDKFSFGKICRKIMTLRSKPVATFASLVLTTPSFLVCKRSIYQLCPRFSPPFLNFCANPFFSSIFEIMLFYDLDKPHFFSNLRSKTNFDSRFSAVC